VDLLLEPERAARDQIVALPTLIRRSPLPERKIIGDLSNRERLLAGLELPDTAVQPDRAEASPTVRAHMPQRTRRAPRPR
jgi:hypothetical protein